MSGELRLRLDAPFAACRPMAAGWYRPAAGFVTPSAMYGLLLNVAGIESRLWEHEPGHDDRTPASLTRPGLPRFELALGRAADRPPPRVASVYQQLHNYPVGASGMPPELSMGTKNNITPVRREVLCGVHAILTVRGNDDFINVLRRGLSGQVNGRYGLPFVGDNSHLPDRLEEAADASAHWYEKVAADAAGTPRPGTERLTVHIDRAGMAATQSALFAPLAEPSAAVPHEAWVMVGGDSVGDDT